MGKELGRCGFESSATAVCGGQHHGRAVPVAGEIQNLLRIQVGISPGFGFGDPAIFVGVANGHCLVELRIWPGNHLAFGLINDGKMDGGRAFGMFLIGGVFAQRLIKQPGRRIVFELNPGSLHVLVHSGFSGAAGKEDARNGKDDDFFVHGWFGWVKVVNGVDAELDLFCQFTQNGIAMADFIREKSLPG
jgi:hypothetical protein